MATIYRDFMIENFEPGVGQPQFPWRYWPASQGYQGRIAAPRAMTEQQCKNHIDNWHEQQEKGNA